eukprot:1449344-Pleurochrysis_carterae.AAC.1
MADQCVMLPSAVMLLGILLRAAVMRECVLCTFVACFMMIFGLQRHWFANECARAWCVFVGFDPGKRVRHEVARCET